MLLDVHDVSTAIPNADVIQIAFDASYEDFGCLLEDHAAWAGDGDLVVDLSSRTQITSADLSAMIALRLRLEANNRKLTLANVSPAIVEVLDISRLTNVLDVCPIEQVETDAAPISFLGSLTQRISNVLHRGPV